MIYNGISLITYKLKHLFTVIDQLYIFFAYSVFDCLYILYSYVKSLLYIKEINHLSSGANYFSICYFSICVV